MKKPTLASLEKRIAALERDLALVMKVQPRLGEWKDWRRAVAGAGRTELAEEVDAAAREIREADRRQVQS